MRWAWLGFVCLLLGSCSLETRKRGQSCQRTAQCALGLACVAARCTTDLSSIAEQNTVPNLGAGAGGEAGSEAGTVSSAGSSGGAGDANP
jgi:hypothetical protein